MVGTRVSVGQPAAVNTHGRATIRWTMGHAAGAHTLLVHVGRISEPLRVVARATPAAPANLSFEHPPAQGKAGHRLGTEVVALVTDSYGNPVPDASVSFATRSGTISPKHAVSDAKGRLKVAWTLAAKPGEQMLTGAVRGTDVKGVLVVHAVGSGPAASVKSASKVDAGGSSRR